MKKEMQDIKKETQKIMKRNGERKGTEEDEKVIRKVLKRRKSDLMEKERRKTKTRHK